MDDPHVNPWLALAANAIRDDSLVRASLRGQFPAHPDTNRVMVRPVLIQSVRRWSVVFRSATRDVTRNLDAEALGKLLAELVSGCRGTACLESTHQVAELDLRQDPPVLKTRTASLASPGSAGHDQARNRLIPASNRGWMVALGVTTPDGRVCRGMEAKFRQINRYVELVGHLLADLPALAATDPIRVVDMGAGKGYLTFALHQYLSKTRQGIVAVRGIEARQDLVERCRDVVRDCGLDGLTFEHSRIADVDVAGADMVVALHACDTATDDAMAKAILAGARLIVVAPCCHKEVRPQLVPKPPLDRWLKHGLWRDRHAEWLTDALRVAALEWCGYATRVTEFIDPDDTRKNTMIAGIRSRERRDRDGGATIRSLLDLYGVRTQRLLIQLGIPINTGPGDSGGSAACAGHPLKTTHAF